MKLNKKATISLFEIIIIILSIISITYLIRDFPLVKAETRQLSDDSLVEVTLQNDGSWVDSSGVMYVEDNNGRLIPKVLYEESLSSSSATSTLNPTSTPTQISSPLGLGTNNAFAGSTQSNTGAASTDNSMAGLQTMAASMGQMGGLLQGPLGEALVWGGVMFGAGMAVGSVLGGGKNMVEALSIAAGVGAFSAKMIQGIFKTSPLVTIAIGVGVGFLVFYLLYEETKYEAVTFQCLPWQAPTGASQSICEICNEEGRPCSEYRCKSLGQTCELVNPGTSEEMCIDVNPKDVRPPVITPNSDELTVGYKYEPFRESPPGPGLSIIRLNSENKCIEAFTPLRFGVYTDEPAQCRIDFNSTTSFDSMYSYMGGSNLFGYEHYEQLVLPYAKDIGNTSFQIENGKDITLYIRCQDKLGNKNEAEYAIKFCVDPSPDTTAPQIKLTSVDNDGCIAATTDSAVVEFYVNEPSQCRWSRDDQSYDLMKNKMVCSNELFEMNAMQLYTCKANLTGITIEPTYFYIRCQDQQKKEEVDRNTNQESLIFSLHSSNKLKLRRIEPNQTQTIYGGINPLPVDIEVETLFGCEKGKANCYFSSNGINGDYILFASTNTDDGVHQQTLYLGHGQHEYYIKCVDIGGNMIINSTKFFVNIDTSSPIIARIYNDEGQLKIVTLRDSQCSYSTENCDFLFEDGIQMPKSESKVHFAEWNNRDTYYIKCKDKYRDLTADCSAVVKPTKLYFPDAE